MKVQMNIPSVQIKKEKSLNLFDTPCKIEKKEIPEQHHEPVDFETAISATGFGIFNILLLIMGAPCSVSTIFETSTMSYILPSAECDLKLTLLNKGVLNAITYGGMIVSAFLWGYLADTLGRKKLLVFGNIAGGILDICCAFSRSYYSLLAFKFFGGFVMCGPYAVIMSYLTEFHGFKHRGIVMMFIGMFVTTASISLPGIAWAILPLDIDWSFFNGSIVIHSWNLFLAVCSIPCLFGGCMVMFFPESPKFLMAQGRNEEALKVFQLIYSLNTGNPRETYPIRELVLEVDGKSKTDGDVEKNDKRKGQTVMTTFRDGLLQLRPMIEKPYLAYSALVYTIQFGLLYGLNTLRLWLPQLFNMLAVFEADMAVNPIVEASTLCDMLDYGMNKSQTAIALDKDCVVTINTTMYMNTIFVGLSGVFSFILVGFLINKMGNKLILIVTMAISASCGFLLYLARSSLVTLILSCIYYAVSNVGTTALLGVCVNLFPTNIRTMVLAMVMTCGRTGSLLGNVIFPIFLSIGCLPPFIMIGGVMIVAGILGCFLPTNTHKNALK